VTHSRAPSLPEQFRRKKEAVVFTEPFLQRDEPGARSPRFHLGDERRRVRAESVDVDVMATSAEAASTAERIAFGLYPDCSMSGDDLALDAVAFSPRAVPAALPFNSSRCEAIFPVDPAKLVSFGNAASLRRGVSLYRVHRYVASASSLPTSPTTLASLLPRAVSEPHFHED
jgi:hypothetical protein